MSTDVERANTAASFVLAPAAAQSTASTIAATQRPNGEIPWFDGGHTDPWDHVEAAMGLDTQGMHDRAAMAYRWLESVQNSDGSWWRGYQDGVPSDLVRETNFTAYLAVGLWHHYLSTGDEDLLHALWPTVRRAMEFVLARQQGSGEVWWALGRHGQPATEALVTGCSSIYQAVRCALRIAELCEHPRPDWELSAARLGHAVVAHPELFSPRDRFSMDWYYPILSGTLTGSAARRRLAASWDTFVVDGLGARCVSDQPWVTGAETAELVLALAATGRREDAALLLGWMQHLRHDDGSYWTGYVYPDDAFWPEERTTWTSGAVLLADAFLRDDPATVAVFGHGQGPVAPDEAACLRCCSRSGLRAAR